MLKWLYIGHQVLDRGEKIELLVDKTEDLRSQVPRIYDLMHVESIGSIDLTTHRFSFARRHKILGNREQRYDGRCGGKT